MTTVTQQAFQSTLSVQPGLWPIGQGAAKPALPKRATLSTARKLHAPSVAEVERIAAIKDPVVRNLQITQAYHELSAAFARLTGPQANWTTFATWASKQAGQTIRGEDLARLRTMVADRAPSFAPALDNLLGNFHHLDGIIHRIHLASIAEHLLDVCHATEHASDAIARGNLKVFTEIGREFARFLDMLREARTYQADRLAAFTASLRPGPAPDGQELLRQAFAHYYQAIFEQEPKARAELIYLANVKIGFHEQTRLQPEIYEAMNSILEALPDLDRVTGLLPHWLHGNLGPMVRGLVATEVRIAATELMMTLGLPHGRLLRLGADLRASFAELLHDLNNAELSELLARLDPHPDELKGSGAADWADLTQRMHFIAEMFRVYHQDATLLEPPFAAEQVRLFKLGQRPVGPL